MVNQNTNKIHCKNGHELSGTNLLKWDLENRGKRACKECRNQRERLRQQKVEVKQYLLHWQRNNKDKISTYSKKWRAKNPGYQKNWDLKNPEKRKIINKRNNDKPERREYQRQWQHDHPRSNTSYPLEVRLAMEYARIRDKNTCQWQGCGLTHNQTSIQVHHIFPKNEYPELAAIPQYMICYCHKHHTEWHEKRNDGNQNFIRDWHKREPIPA